MDDNRLKNEFETIHQALARLALEAQQKELMIRLLMQQIDQLRERDGMEPVQWNTETKTH